MRLLLIIGLLMLSLSGCITQPKPILQANAPAGLDRGDVELAILLATGLSTPDNETVATWPEYVSATLRNAGDRHVSRLDEADDEDRWVFDTADGKTITASYVDGKEILRVAIDYNASNYTIRITGSEHLNESATKIDPVAEKWLSDLTLRINRALGRVQLMKRTFHPHHSSQPAR